MDSVEKYTIRDVMIRKARSSHDVRPTKTTKAGSRALNSLTKSGPEKSVDHVDVQQEGEWEKIVLKVDSGAIDTCIPPHVGQHFRLSESNMSRNQEGYRAANGTKIKNHGERSVCGLTDDWNSFKLKTQVADVRTPLGSVYHMVKSGNTVIFHEGGGEIRNNHSGRVIPIKERSGSYEVDLWVPANKSPA